MQKLWGTAFSKEPSEAVIAFTAGRDVAAVPPADEALLPYDLWVNKAHCVMLAKTGIIPVSDAAKILAGLNELEKDTSFHLDPSKEDVHTNIESYLTAKLGTEVAGKLHTARSRNDQVATDMKLFMRDAVLFSVKNSIGLAHTLLALADQHKAVPFPGFTHHQHAMVTTFGHILAGFATMILRDIERFQNWYALHNQNPLGNSVAYGTSFPINKKLTAELLGFDGPDINSLDAITNRWEPEADLAFAITILMNHLSTIAHTLILLATTEFGMIQLADEFSTGSSIMPQKRNPDPLEVIKAKASFAQGQLVSLLGIGKTNFIGYNRDTQWTKYLIMDLVAECLPAAVVLKGMLETLIVDKEAMAHWCTKAMIGATSLLEQFASFNNIPFRVAKVVVEKAIKYSQQTDVVNYGAMLKALKEEKLDIAITRKQIRAWQDPQAIIEATHSFGGPGKEALGASLEILGKECDAIGLWLVKKKEEIVQAKTELAKEISNILEKGNI